MGTKRGERKIWGKGQKYSVGLASRQSVRERIRKGRIHVQKKKKERKKKGRTDRKESKPLKDLKKSMEK